MSMTKRYLDSLSDDEQDAILGKPDYGAEAVDLATILREFAREMDEEDEWPDDDVYCGEGDLEC